MFKLLLADQGSGLAEETSISACSCDEVCVSITVPLTSHREEIKLSSHILGQCAERTLPLSGDFQWNTCIKN